MTQQTNEIRNLEDLYQTYAGPVYGYLLRMSDNPALADDLTSETFFQAMLGLDGFAGRSSVKTWLLRIARYLYIRRSQRERRHTSLEALEDQGADFPATSPGPERTLEQREQVLAVRRALDRLSEDDRSLLALSLQENLTQAEIAEILEVSVGAVKVRLCRTRQRLAAAVAEETTPTPEAHCR